jgi:probable F420-dependent oxidoreductase
VADGGLRVIGHHWQLTIDISQLTINIGDMKFDTAVLSPNLSEMAAFAEAAEEIGFDGLWVGETASNPFLPLALAAEHSRRIELGTAIAVAFPRSPTILAHLAWDLARYSNGRFILGLGPQIKAHNVRRLGATWEKPVLKLRETIEAMGAIWDSWQEGAPLRYRGEFFRLSLMTPFFSPEPLEVPRPPIYIAAVNRGMLRLAGELCQGVHIHALHTVKYLREFAWPHLEEGLRSGGKRREDFTAVASVFVVPTDGRKPVEDYEALVREQLSFYMSTPAYLNVLELHGWEEVGPKLSRLALRGRWQEMPALVTDEMLDAFAVSGKWAELPGLIKDRYGDLLDRVNFYLPFVPGEEDENWREVVRGFAAKADGSRLG